jgi:DNA repair exonuclease SbcCD ATPase subunit
MIVFEKLRWKNFLSTGGQFTEIFLNKSPTTLIVGENGAGKSTMLDALCFGLFGKAFRNINKPQLVSSVNQKDCLVEIDFSIGKKKYLVRRGIKPAIFEIYINGTLLDQEAAARDQQAFLEEQILKINFRSFTQIVILGSASFTPFMQLPAAHRREIIEDILDIKIFSEMNVLLKERMSALKDAIRSIENKIEVQKEKTILQKSFIKTLEEKKKKQNEDVQKHIDEALDDIRTNMVEVIRFQQEVQTLQATFGDESDKQAKLKKYYQCFAKIESKLATIDKDIAFYSENDTCPTCDQHITQEAKETAIGKHTHSKKEIEEAMSKAKVEMEQMSNRIKEIQQTQEQITVYQKKIDEYTTKNLAQGKLIDSLRKQIEPENSHDISAEKVKLRDMAADVVQLSNQRSQKNEEKQYLDICGILLKDTGIKTTVIRQYLPVINKFINKYLTIMDFFVHFELDESFNESIKSRYRDDFSYASFSEGEKAKINLALLFTWRQVAKIKNSVNTNLLILDEVFDGSLDGNGTEYVMQMINTLAENNNIFVISHKDALNDKFRSQIKFIKKNNFSLIDAKA